MTGTFTTSSILGTVLPRAEREPLPSPPPASELLARTLPGDTWEEPGPWALAWVSRCPASRGPVLPAKSTHRYKASGGLQQPGPRFHEFSAAASPAFVFLTCQVSLLRRQCNTKRHQEFAQIQLSN